MRFAAQSCIRAGAALMALAVPLSSGWAQCSVCQAALAGAENSDGITGGFRQGIALMFVVMGVLGVLGWRISRRVRKDFAIRQSPHSNTATATSSCLPAENPASR